MVVKNLSSGKDQKRKLMSRGNNDLHGVNNNFGSSMYRNTFFDKSISLPWVSPYKAH